MDLCLIHGLNQGEQCRTSIISGSGTSRVAYAAGAGKKVQFQPEPDWLTLISSMWKAIALHNVRGAGRAYRASCARARRERCLR